MKKLLIEGWRGVNHSFAMVNQHQLLALARLKAFDIYHKDMPFFMAHWDEKRNSAGFDQGSAAFIAGLTDLAAGSADVIYRICAPIRPPAHQGAMEITFIVTEFGLDPASFSNPEVLPGAFTTDGNIVVTPSRWSRDRLLDYGFDEQGVRVVGHGVDTVAFNPLTVRERAFNRSNLGIDPDTTVFLNVGAPIWNKGGDLLVEAFARVHRRHPRTRLILKDARQLYGLSAEETVREVGARHPELITDGLISAISVIPGNMTQAELRLLYGVSDWYVSPYRAEGFNLPVLEALACGRPVIVTSGGATDDFCNGDAVRRIPSTFHRGRLNGKEESCRLEPHLPSLVEMMADAASQGPDPQGLSDAAVEQAKLHGWDRAALELGRLVDGGHRDIQLPPPRPRLSLKRSIHLYCDGGFGNRFNTLVSGMVLAKAAGLQPIVVWPCNNWCGASFSELMENDYNVIERELVSYLPEKDEFHFFMTEDHLGMGVPNKSPLENQTLAEAVNYLNSDSRDVYYHSPLIPPFLSPDEVLQQVRELKINSKIIAQANQFVSDQGLDAFFGVQIRKTDFGSNGSDDNSLFGLLRDCPDERFFVCSDDADVETRFSSLPNVTSYPKRAYVERLVDGGWNMPTADHSGRVYACNVNRNAISVEDAVVDLIILSYSQVLDTSNSTFRNTALLMQTARNSVNLNN